MLGLGGFLAFLVGPVGGEAVLGLGVHLLRADLDFDPHLLVVDHRGVDRLAAYEQAVAQRYLWHEFGDSTLFLP
jgi:hypothetical protein